MTEENLDEISSWYSPPIENLDINHLTLMPYLSDAPIENLDINHLTLMPYLPDAWRVEDFTCV